MSDEKGALRLQRKGFRDKLYEHVSSMNFADEPAKQRYLLIAQNHLESTMKNDSTDFCSTCFTKNASQWRMKLNPCQRIGKRLKKDRTGSKSQKCNELVLTCIVCRKEKKQLLNKPKN